MGKVGETSLSIEDRLRVVSWACIVEGLQL